MKIYTSYFANTRNLAKNGIVPISIARISPDWFNGCRFLFLAPSKQLLYNRSLTDEAYEREYNKEVCSRLDPNFLRREIEKVANGHDVALLCYEKPGEECHRHTLAKWMNEHGFNVMEFGAEAKKEEKLIEPSLFDGF